MGRRNYFPFYNYECALDVSAQSALMPGLIPLDAGLRESHMWYVQHPHLVREKPLIEYIASHLA